MFLNDVQWLAAAGVELGIQTRRIPLCRCLGNFMFVLVADGSLLAHDAGWVIPKAVTFSDDPKEVQLPYRNVLNTTNYEVGEKHSLNAVLIRVCQVYTGTLRTQIPVSIQLGQRRPYAGTPLYTIL